jgi:hypothetical protein
MTQTRLSSFGTTPEQEEKLKAAQSLHSRLEKANLHILQHRDEFKSHKFDQDDDETENIDPSIVSADVGAQLVRLEQPRDVVVPLILCALDSRFCGNSSSSISSRTLRIDTLNPS